MIISVVIATHNRAALLETNIRHLMATGYPASAFEVIVIDDCSTDATPAVLAELAAAYPNLSWTRTKENVGPARARNEGIRRVAGEIVAITDDDIWVDDRWLFEIERFFKEHPAALGVHGIIAIRDADRDQITPFTKQAESSRYGDFYTGNIAYRREALLKAGGFDEHFPPSNEDMELGLAVASLGTIGFEPTMLVYHPVFPSTFWAQVRFRQHYWTELVLDRRYPAFYRSLRGGSALRTMLGYWLLKVFVVDGMRYCRDYWRQPVTLFFALLRLIVERVYCLALFPWFLVKAQSVPPKRDYVSMEVT